MGTNETLILPANVRGNAIAAEAIKQAGKKGEEARERLVEEGQKAKSLPQPTGYRILVAIPKAEHAFDGEVKILKADMTREAEEIMTVVGLVVAMGPDCYHDLKRFPNGPWCKLGDFVVMRAYSGTRVRIYGKEWRLVNDDTVEAVVEDPRGISRV
jgi:co-chaperonin GroES (HSP10)